MEESSWQVFLFLRTAHPFFLYTKSGHMSEQNMDFGLGMPVCVPTLLGAISRELFSCCAKCWLIPASPLNKLAPTHNSPDHRGILPPQDF